MSSTTRIFQLLAVPALLLAMGCASNAPAPGPVPEARAEATPDPDPVTIRPAATAAKLDPVYFDTDRALLRPDAREALKRHAKAIVAHPEWGVLEIDGHCDERGSEEYNLALGKRRAEVVRRYLVDLGVPSARLDTRTFGEQKPAVAGHGESVWRQNRRSEIQPETLHSANR